MLTHFGLGAFRPEWLHAVACIGTFDGVHRGHQAVIERAVERAKEMESPCVVLTFDRNPATVLSPSTAPKALAPLQENLQSMALLGVSAAIVLEFSPALREMKADDFLQSILVDTIRAKHVVVGHDFKMGHDRIGTAEWIQTKIATDIVPPFIDGEVRISSTAIRSLVQEGQMEEAARLLGRPFTIHGVVVGGQKLGRTLGFPTVNLARSIDQVIPADGVYAATYESPFGTFQAALAIGTRPAVGGGDRTIEAFLLDYPGESLYGTYGALKIIKKLRPELNFSSLDALVEQMKIDVEETRRVIASR